MWSYQRTIEQYLTKGKLYSLFWKQYYFIPHKLFICANKVSPGRKLYLLAVAMKVNDSGVWNLQHNIRCWLKCQPLILSKYSLPWKLINIIAALSLFFNGPVIPCIGVVSGRLNGAKRLLAGCLSWHLIIIAAHTSEQLLTSEIINLALSKYFGPGFCFIPSHWQGCLGLTRAKVQSSG